MLIGTSRSVLLRCVLLLLTPLMGQAQEYQAKVNGTIRDANGAAVAGVEVSLLHKEAVVASAVTDASGSFTLSNVPPANYELRVIRTGFSPYRSALSVPSSGLNDVAVVL